MRRWGKRWGKKGLEAVGEPGIDPKNDVIRYEGSVMVRRANVPSTGGRA